MLKPPSTVITKDLPTTAADSVDKSHGIGVSLATTVLAVSDILEPDPM